MSPEPWRQLRVGAGPDAPSLLCIDFTQGRTRTQAGFADLAALLPPPYAVWGTEEPAWLATDLAPAPTTDVRGVLGYCAGASIACAVARRLAAGTGTAPPVVLFDPVAVTAQTLHHQFTTAVDSIAAVAPQPDLLASRAAAQAEVAAADDLATLATRLADRYAALARPACAAQRVPDSIINQLCDRVGGYLRYLVRSSTLPLECAGPTLVVLSETHEPPPIRGDHRQVRVPATQVGLLANADAADAATAALAGDPLAAQP